MANRLYTKRGGLPGAAMDLITNTAPAFDFNTPLIELGMSCQNGGASQGTFTVEDPLDNYLTPTGLWFPTRTLVRWTEDASGTELWLSQGRISGGEMGRGKMHADNYVEHVLTVDDANVDLRGLAFTEDWARGAETGVDRLYALQAYILNGTSSTSPTYRPSTTITIDDTHLAPNAGTTTMQAKTYPAGTQPQEVVDDCATTEGKVYGVVIHHTGGSHLCLFYTLEANHSLWLSPVTISDDNTLINSSTSYRTAVLATTPISYWRLGESSGTTAVDQMGANNGTYVNTPTLGVTGALTGDLDTAVSFAAASSEYVSIAPAAALHPGDTFSVSAWIKRAGSGTDDFIYMNYAVGDIQLWIWGGDDKLYLSAGFGGHAYTSSSTITDTDWHHIVVTKAGTSLAIGYIDGALVANTAGGVTITATVGADTYIAAGAAAFDGSIDEVAFWNRALTPTEIATLYTSGSTAPIFAPIWDQGMGTASDGQAVISGLVSHWTTTDFVYVNYSAFEDEVETWIDSFDDADAVDATEASIRATAILNYRSPGNSTFRFSVLVPADQVGLLCAGMSITINTAVIIGGPLLGVDNTIRIVQLTWQPAADGLYWAHMLLNRGYRSMPPSRGKFKKALPEASGG